MKKEEERKGGRKEGEYNQRVLLMVSHLLLLKVPFHYLLKIGHQLFKSWVIHGKPKNFIGGFDASLMSYE